ncbi:sulfate adenylyltransferase [Candidatus Endobugula sertula]|uniref:Sulfate adenylyltransferase n=1 Tax=Candidatus Endobugula sertula TaxID=62101 RepID=A0A1D2QNQ2_9GAMM|nr:sulfate adenylyltransferase [Candidatus Endobugula sertula]
MKKRGSFHWDVVTVIVSGATLLSSTLSQAMPSYRYMSDKALLAIEKKYGERARKRVSHWTGMINALAVKESLTDRTAIWTANNYFNKVQWKWDIEHWGVEDYWATPVETLATNAGDCEDFSIGKYFSLTNMGIKTSKLRITYVKALDYNLAHMVLVYYASPNAEPLILDNINKTILPASKRKDLLPVYGFNGDGIWLAKSSKKFSTSNPAKNLPSWGKLNQRMLKVRIPLKMITAND